MIKQYVPDVTGKTGKLRKQLFKLWQVLQQRYQILNKEELIPATFQKKPTNAASAS